MEHTTHYSSAPSLSLHRLHPAYVAAAIIGVTTLVRLLFVASGMLNLSPDESQYWDWSRTLQLSYYSKGPLVTVLMKFWTSIFGTTEFGVRVGAVVNSLVIQLVLYWGVARVWNRPWLAVWTLFIANTMPLFMAAGVLMTTDNPLILCWTACLFLLYRMSGERPGRLDAVLFGVILALGILAKYMMLAFIPVSLLFFWMLSRAGRLGPGAWARLAAGTVLGLGGGFLPIFLWNLQNDWVGFRHVFSLGGFSGSDDPLIRFDKFPEYLGSQILLLTPWWFVFLLWGALKAGRNQLQGRELPFGLSYRQSALLMCAFWPVWLFFLLWSFHTAIYPNWSAVTYVGGILFAAFAWERFWHRTRGAWKKIWMGLSVAVFLLVHLSPMIPFPAEYDPMHRLAGWEDLGETIQELKQSRFPDPDQVFTLSDRYGVTAGLSFYVPGKARSYNVDEGRRMTQYDLWPGPEGKTGWDAIYVRKGWKENITPRVKDMFGRVGERIELQTMHNGRKGRKFTLFLLYDYNGYWPEQEKESF